MSTAADLRRARKLIAKGWCKGVYCKRVQESPPRSEFCAYGAVVRACGDFGAGLESEDHATKTKVAAKVNACMDILGVIIGDRKGIITWNDRQKTTKEEVLHVFDAASAMAEM